PGGVRTEGREALDFRMGHLAGNGLYLGRRSALSCDSHQGARPGCRDVSRFFRVSPKERTTMTVTPVRRALLSVSDKTGLVELARGLASLGVELISTGGTRKALAEAGLLVRDISEVTGFPAILDGRGNALHPRIHGGILAVRGNPEHTKTIEAHGIQPIDLVVCNLYPFEQMVAKAGSTHEDIVENIDIGGPSMVRSAAKNYHDVAIVTDPAQYAVILEELRAHGGLGLPTRERLAAPPLP